MLYTITVHYSLFGPYDELQYVYQSLFTVCKSSLSPNGPMRLYNEFCQVSFPTTFMTVLSFYYLNFQFTMRPNQSPPFRGRPNKLEYTRAPQSVHNTPVMNILKGYFYIILF